MTGQSENERNKAVVVWPETPLQAPVQERRFDSLQAATSSQAPSPRCEPSERNPSVGNP